MKTKNLKTKWYDRHLAAFGLSLGSLGAAYFLALRALDTGSLQQYFVTLLLVGFGSNRLVHVIRPARKAKA